MELFMIVCATSVVTFGFLLLISTMCMGSTILIPLQVLMGSLRYNKEIDEKLSMELGKVDAGLYYVRVKNTTIELYLKEQYKSEEETHNSTPNLEIWIENKFYSYGNIYRVNGKNRVDLSDKRPSILVLKQIYELQISNGEQINKKKNNKEKEKSIILE